MRGVVSYEVFDCVPASRFNSSYPPVVSSRGFLLPRPEVNAFMRPGRSPFCRAALYRASSSSVPSVCTTAVV